jgi:hypothetical protein
MLALAVVAAFAALASPPRGGSTASADECYRIWAEAQEEGSRYRHLVYVRNDCDYWLECSVWTDATPQPPKMLTVGPGETEQAETTEDSPSDDPKAFGGCRKQ